MTAVIGASLIVLDACSLVMPIDVAIDRGLYNMYDRIATIASEDYRATCIRLIVGNLLQPTENDWDTDGQPG